MPALSTLIGRQKASLYDKNCRQIFSEIEKCGCQTKQIESLKKSIVHTAQIVQIIIFRVDKDSLDGLLPFFSIP